MALCWSTSLKTAPTSEPIDLPLARTHCELGDDTTHDSLLQVFIAAARQKVESITNRALITQAWYWKGDSFPGYGGRIVLPRPPLVSITSISYVDTNGDTQTWAAGATGYQLVKPAGPTAAYASILPSYSLYYPVARTQPEAVTVEYVCGYGDANSVPAAIKAAMLLLIGHWFENREAIGADLTFAEMPMGVDALLGPYTVDRWV